MEPSAELSRSETPPFLDAGRQIERERTRKFLISHWVILGITALTMAGNLATGAMGDEVTRQFFWLVGIVGGLTLFATIRYRQGAATLGLVAGILYVDSAAALIYFYLGGEFETPSMGLLTIPLIMAPVYTKRYAVWVIAFLQIVLYLFLVAGRMQGWLDWLPYSYMVDPDSVAQPQFVVLCLGAFVTVTVAVAVLSGETTIDVLTSRRQLQDEVDRQTHALAESNAQLQATNLALAQFNAAVSHDLRSPLQTVALHLELLLEDAERATPVHPTAPEGGQVERIGKALNAAQRMGRMIGDLQELARTTHRMGDLVPVDLDRALGQVLDDLGARIERAHATVELVGPLPQVQGNEGLLRRVLQNLVENAIKYGAKGPRIRIGGLPREGDKAGFFVEDDGPGIDRLDEGRIFMLFQRLERDAGSEGSGAGLAIVHRIVTAHGGTVTVAPGQVLPGARFVVMLGEPVAKPI